MITEIYFLEETYHLSFAWYWGHDYAVATHSPPTPEVCSSNPEPYAGKMVVSYQWPAIYSTGP